ncbi:phage portal protein [Bradyrhizobium sp. C-145]|uniref:phage portal protein n=1 Tax=Bradyrhizobium sp. C-145 TaxID=574727 RepID=UPI00201B972E|nr:phage portal protein [Bradyrhizobium sp. C-145]UQR68121.1 phage portal protein [Bradyrhizobium sp. C-145]
MPAPISQQLAASRVAARKIGHQSQNNALMASIIQHAVTAIVGDGPSVRSAHPDPEIAAQLHAAWNKFFADCSVEGGMSLGGYLSRKARAFYVDGESFTKLVVDPDTTTLKLQLLSADQVDNAKTIPSLGMTGDTPNIVAGIEFDSTGRRSAYWVLPTPPDSPWASVAPPVRVPALDICHLFEPQWPGVPRGISPLTPVAGLARDLDDCLDAANVKMKVSAVLTAFVRDPEGYMFQDHPMLPMLEPGAIMRLPEGADVQFSPTSDMASLSEVLTHIERMICSGAGVPAFFATGDYGSVNYSAGKLALASFQRRVKAIQQNHLVAQLLNPIWDRIVMLEVLSGRMRAPDYESNPERYAASFLFPGWPAIDELKKAKADTLAVAAKLRSRADIIAEQGRDITDVDTEIAADPFAEEDLSSAATNISNQTDTENEDA